MTSLSLYQLNQLIKESLRQVIPTSIWLRAEIHNITTNYSGHCYIDLIEKSDFNDQIIARQRATIWASTYRYVAQKFQQASNSSLQTGMKILVEVSVEFHELYGLSLNVKDIDPTYTLGELQRRRLEIIQRLKNRGLIDKNRQLPMPRLVQRIAVISSPTAAGYADFVHQLQNNPHGFAYSITLFPAIMQGPQTEESILSALDKIINFQLSTFNFQLVVIIRGGGATSDLQAFDSELLAERCANFPLPIITGIGHLRDETILDMVAYCNLKTPTAVAEYIISRTLDVSFFLDEMAEKIQTSVRISLEKESNYLLLLSAQIPQIVQRKLTQSVNYINDLQYRMQLKTADFIAKNHAILDRREEQIKVLTLNLLKSHHSQLDILQTKLQLLDPQQLLKKGYSFTTHNGKLVTSITQLTPGDTITTTLADGTVDSMVK
ncbi:MAG: exodeoxyribonuclease VII large subunit [Paludibacteraceae bacterium]|nr:exodeoxyribonuclease VII large subunit [Paludibacteraceae bacterium]